jgi:hypothetical protein
MHLLVTEDQHERGAAGYVDAQRRTTDDVCRVLRN